MSYVDLFLVVVIITGIYGLLAVSLNLHWGDTGLLNFAHVGFFAIGAYVSAILTTPPESGPLAVRTVGFDFPIIVGILSGAVLAAIAGVAIAVTSVRLEGDYLAMVTLSFGELIHLFIANQGSITGGVQSLSNIERPLSGVVPVQYDLFYAVLVVGVLVLVTVLLRRLSQSPFGRVLKGIREDEAVPRSVGKRTVGFKLKSMGIGAGIAGVAGGLWAHYMYTLTPGMFVPSLLFLIWAGVIIGGPGSYFGVILGTMFVVGVRQATRFLPNDMPFYDQLPYLRVMLIGALLILVLYYRPYGLLGDKERMAAGKVQGSE